MASLQSLIANIPIQPLAWSLATSANVHVDVLRCDLLDSKLGGNKLFKLWGHLQHFFSTDHEAMPIASFGGAYSNHLYALAAAGERLGISTIGVVRGEQPKTPSQTLIDLESMNMRLCYLSRSDYKNKNNPVVRAALASRLGLQAPPYWIPEGGAGHLGMVGCEVLGHWLAAQKYTHILHACGTGTTLLGLSRGLVSAHSENNTLPAVLGISALRSDRAIINSLCEDPKVSGNKTLSWSLSNQFHHGGFAKSSVELTDFMARFFNETAIPTDRVYTGKLLYALANMLKSSLFRPGSCILVVHSGGLQGNRN